MLAVKVTFKDAEDIKKFLLANSLYDKNFVFKKDKKNIFFPIKNEESRQIIIDKFPKTIFEEIELESRDSPSNLKEALQEKLSEEELDLLKTSFDVVGTIAILEIDPPLDKKQKLIAETILKIHKGIKTVVRKADKHDGTFRTQKMEFIAGEKTLETIHKENNIQLFLNVQEVYFSTRLSTERKRISQIIKPKEKILVMFSGCAPYPCVFSKNTEADQIVGIEINPKGHDYGIKNIELNKLTNITLINGDVKEIIPDLIKQTNQKFDRILMPLPKSAEDFLDAALIAAKKHSIIHFYAFLHEDNFHEAHDAIAKACKKNKLDHKIIRTVKCGQHAPRVYRICVDFEVL
ncbi:class I SAM-dependent methyltransferase family protein [Candidatus Woesearchaeota archaeon]|jgi:tRNA (guanine37-N1)-methyltransferase|nr:class I SAM-dependent methyltransferase family protein [Candidatus Woesearchaeota archaeon]MBT6520245.1 class I SAM-dependent methyltransferase family protein [Candidatus Woesearchaeota archaeon]MBT7367256.1 class I SAM-dependent methyltransferase family protein [Candidatus Woesearchaeota archaeon]